MNLITKGSWSALVIALVAWELIALRSSPRSEHPTISSLVEGLAHHHVARLALFALWGRALLDTGVVTVSRSLTIAGWVLIAVGFTAASLGAVLSRGRFPPLLAMVRVAMRNVVIRVIALAGWAWAGWHFFVRTSR